MMMVRAFSREIGSFSIPEVWQGYGFRAFRIRQRNVPRVGVMGEVFPCTLFPKPHRTPHNADCGREKREMKATILAAAVALTMTACASTPQYRPVVDHGVSTGDYETDLAECRELAQSSRASAGKGAVGGAIAGALLGAMMGRAAGL